MRGTLRAAVALLLVPMFFASSQSWAQVLVQDLLPNPKIEVFYSEPTSARLKPIYERLKQRRVLERLAIFLSPIKLTLPLKISTAECGGMTRAHSRANGATVCYEFVEEVKRLAQPGSGLTKEKVVAGAFAQGTLYRVSLAIIDILDVPVWGRYTDAADRLTANLMLEFGPDVAQMTFRGAYQFFLTAAKQGKIWDGSDFAATRSPDKQRMYNYLCMAFGHEILRNEGSNAAIYPSVLDGSTVAEFAVALGPRLRRCVGEYSAGLDAFVSTIFTNHIDAGKWNKIAQSRLFDVGDFSP